MFIFTEAHKMSKKINQMINDVSSLYDSAVGLINTYTETFNIIELIQNSNDLNYDLTYLAQTKQRLTMHHQEMGVSLMPITSKVNTYRAYGATINDHMNLICLGEEIAQWTDRYKAIIIEPCINVVRHIESVRNQFKNTPV